MEEDQFWSFGRVCTGGAMKNQHTEQCPEAVRSLVPRLSEKLPPKSTRTHGEHTPQGKTSSHVSRGSSQHWIINNLSTGYIQLGLGYFAYTQKRPAFQPSHGLRRSQGLPPPIKHRTSLATKAQFRIVFIMEI